MTRLSNLQVPPPSKWQDFEELCWELWKEIWKDPNTLRHGRQGQSQNGVDVHGRPKQKKLWAGIQCKGKDNYDNKTLTKKEVNDEVNKAKTFKPKLSEFIIATTGKKDVEIERVAREITVIHQRKGLFSVSVIGWDDIKGLLNNYPELIERYCYVQTNTTIVKDEIKRSTEKILYELTQQGDKTKNDHNKLTAELKSLISPSTSTIPITNLDDEYHAELDQSRHFLESNKPKEALELLENFKARNWPKAKQIIKFRVLTNIAAAKLSLNQDQEAARLFLEAFQYNNDDEKALSNVALGYLLLGELEKADSYAKKVLEKNPTNSQAFSIIIDVLAKTEATEDIIKKIPDICLESPEVAYRIAQIEKKRGKFNKAKDWFEIAVKNDKDNVPDFKASLAIIILELIIMDQTSIYLKQIDDKKRIQIQKAIKLFDEAWQCIYKTSLRNYRLEWIVNRSSAKRLLGDLNGAILDIEIALEVEEANPNFIFQRAILAHEHKDNEHAIKLLQKIVESNETPEAALLLAEILKSKKEYQEAIKVIKKFLENVQKGELRDDAQRLLIQSYIDSENFIDAKRVSDSMRESDPTSILNLVFAANIQRLSNDKAGAVSLLEEARKYVIEDTMPRDLIFLADEFYFLDKFDDAAQIYENTVNKNIDNNTTRRLLNSYYQSGNVKESLNMCQTLLNNYGPLNYVSEMESAIYEKIGDLTKARKACQIYLESFPDDLEMEIRLAVINYRSNNFKDLDIFLNSKIDTNSLSLEMTFQLVHLYSERGLNETVFKTLYEARRKHFNNADAHLNYFNMFFRKEKDIEQLLYVNKVCEDTAVHIEDDTGNRQWYIIEKRNDTDFKRGEIDLHHPLAQNLYGKAVGESIFLKSNTMSKENGKIIEIKSKFVYALHETLELFERLFPDKQCIWKINVEKTNNGKLPEGIKDIIDKNSASRKKFQHIEKLYEDGNLTVESFAYLIGRNVFETWVGLRKHSNIGLKCCLGNIKERDHAVTLLSEKPKLVIDIISLLTLKSIIDNGDVIIKVFGKFGIAQSTIDLIKAIVSEYSGTYSEGYHRIGKDGEKYIVQEINAKDIKRNIELLENILEWTKNNCEILPCKAALSIKSALKKELDELLGKSFIDTSLIASEEGNILYSDDERLRSFAMNEFNVKGVWTQVLLTYSLNNNYLNRNEYNKDIIKMVEENYFYISIDASVLIEAAKQSKWEPVEPYNAVLKVLKGSKSDESALKVSSNFLFELWKQPISPNQRDYLILKLLDAILIERNTKRTIEKLIYHIRRRFVLLPLAEEQIIRFIDAWEKSRLIYLP